MEHENENRRSFMKNAAIAGGVAAYGIITASVVLKKQKTTPNSGVLVGNSKKKEVLYHESKHWDEYYSHAV